MYNWITLLYTWNYHIVNQLYSKVKLKVKKRNMKNMQQKLLDGLQSLK